MTLCPCSSPVCEQRRAMVALLREARELLADDEPVAQRIDALLREVEE